MTFPQLIIEAGFSPTSPAVASTDLLLDDPVYGLLDTGTLADDTEWTDISDYVQDGTVTRPFTRQQGPLTLYQGGTATFTLNNSDGRFDPQNLSGPYVSAGVTQVRPMIPVRMRAVYNGVTYYLFSGFATSWTPPPDNFGPNYDQTVLAAADAFRALTNINLATASAAGAGEDTGARITRILEAAGWYSSSRGQSVIDTGNSTLQATTFGASALSLMQLATDSEVGELYMDGQGRAVFRNRDAILTDTASGTVQGYFGSAGGSAGSGFLLSEAGGFLLSEDGSSLLSEAGTAVPLLECTSLTRPSDDTTLANDVQATNVGGTLQEAMDSASVATYLFPRTYARSDLILQTDTDALNWANYVLYLAGNSEYRIDQVTITPGNDPDGLFPQALGRDFGDRIQVWKQPPGVAAYSVDLFVRGITHSFSPVWWQTTWDTQNADRYSFFVLGDAILGTLDDNALAW